MLNWFREQYNTVIDTLNQKVISDNTIYGVKKIPRNMYYAINNPIVVNTDKISDWLKSPITALKKYVIYMMIVLFIVLLGFFILKETAVRKLT